MSTEASTSQSPDPVAHARVLSRQLQDLRDQFREDVEKMEDPRAQALFETSAEVLTSLIKALSDFQDRSHHPWRQQ